MPKLQNSHDLFDSVPSRFQPPLFLSGQRVGFVGDSLTRLGMYHRNICLFYATRYPSRKLIARNFGISGNTAEGCVNRYRWDIAPFKADVLTITTGVNDSRIWLYETNAPDATNLAEREKAIDTHVKSTRKFVKMAKEDGSQVIIISPALYDQTAEMECPKRTGVNDALRRMSDSDRKTAEAFGCPFIDLNTPMMKINRVIQEANPQSTLIGLDRVHPREVGQLVMAIVILKAQGVTPVVAEVSLDARAQEHVMTRNCTISEQHVDSERINFTYQANALPFPLRPDQKAIADFYDFQSDMNGEIISIDNLPAGKYRICIDGKPLTTASARQLADGINLSLLHTPQASQANEVRKILEKRHLLEQRLRIRMLLKQQFFADRDDLTWKEEKAILLEALGKLGTVTIWDTFRAKCIREYMKVGARHKELWNKVDDMTDEIYKLNKPMSHVIDIQQAR
ncbi:MAG: SGNH/GDSL hydrolase family protein [Victivallales bacterium]|nr:SGNH/GDSL hydrolase family protein [Victivallales bacterium]